MTIKELREKTGLSQQKFGDYFGIPRRTIQNWEMGTSECNQYIVEMMEYKLKNEGLIEESEKKDSFKVEATVIMESDMTVDKARKRITNALKEAGAKSLILDVE